MIDTSVEGVGVLDENEPIEDCVLIFAELASIASSLK